MWQRTKRLINSYLDDLIEKSEKPDSQVRDVTRAELARLTEIEVRATASAKLMEKELARVEAKLASQSVAGGSPDAELVTQQQTLKNDIRDAYSKAEQAHGLRDTTRTTGKEMEVETHLTSLKENLASLETPFGSGEAGGTIEEMRAKIELQGGSETDRRVAEADAQMRAEQRQHQIDELLSQYKDRVDSPTPFTDAIIADASSNSPASASQSKGPSITEPNVAQPVTNPESTRAEDPGAGKSLGPAKGPVRPID